MPVRPNTTISAQLNSALMIISNTIDQDDIRSLVSARGYNAAVLNEGKRLYDVASAAVDNQAAAASKLRIATDQVQEAERQAQISYQRLAKTVRAIFPANASELKALEMTSRMPKENSAFITAALTLFNNAIKVSEIATVLARYGYDEQTLTDEREHVRVLQQTIRAQAIAKGAAKEATRVQNEALAALQQWVARYIKIARIALSERPALLDTLGLATRRRVSAARESVQSVAV